MLVAYNNMCGSGGKVGWVVTALGIAAREAFPAGPFESPAKGQSNKMSVSVAAGTGGVCQVLWEPPGRATSTQEEAGTGECHPYPPLSPLLPSTSFFHLHPSASSPNTHHIHARATVICCGTESIFMRGLKVGRAV